MGTEKVRALGERGVPGGARVMRGGWGQPFRPREVKAEWGRGERPNHQKPDGTRYRAVDPENRRVIGIPGSQEVPWQRELLKRVQ